MAWLKRILMVVTSYNHLDANHPTGVWFEEFAIPYQEFRANGFEVTVASPQGGAAPIDPRSEPGPEQVREATEAREALQHTVRLDSINAHDFDAIFIPGGHGPLFDFPGNIPLQNTLRTYMEQGKLIASVCHGPAAFDGVLLSNGMPLVAGKTMTAFTNHEESTVQLDKLVPFLVETRLRELGAQFVERPAWSDHIERDGNLITGQNHQSSHSAARMLIEVLK
jgi:putative intracellular protease/amidase